MRRSLHPSGLAANADAGMQALADWVILSSGWTRRLVAFAAGAFGALALAPINAGPALIVPMTTAIWLIDGADERRPSSSWFDMRSLRLAFASGWWLGFGYFVAGFWWLGAAFLIDPEFTWALPLGIFGLPALLALFPAFGFGIARLVWVTGAARVLALALGLGISEWARGHWFTGFPWNAFGMGLGGILVTAQAASLVGLDGLTFLAVAIAAAPATLFDGRTGMGRWSPTGLAAGVSLAIVLFGAVRLMRDTPTYLPDVIIRIMQPGLRPDINFSPENGHDIVSHYLALSEQDNAAKRIALRDVTLLVWPESAFPFILTREAEELARIGAALPEKTTLVTGAAREENEPSQSGPAHSVYYNTMDVIVSGGDIVGSYDKVHLVPFGEYLPLDALLRRWGLHNFVAVPGGFAPGKVRRPLNIPRMPPAVPLICYEAIFSGDVMVRGETTRRPGYLLNITNDGWFGQTSGPAQHFLQARLQSIEEGLPMVRGAATGISAVLDPYGRTLASLPLGSEGILDSKLPKPISQPLFKRTGTWPVLMVWFTTVLFLGKRRFTKLTWI